MSMSMSNSMSNSITNDNSYNDIYVNILKQYANKVSNEWTTPEERKQAQFKSSAYKKAAQTISKISHPITDPQQLIQVPGIGKSIIEKLMAYYHNNDTITSAIIIEETPIDLFTNIYGIGSVKAKEIVDKGFTTIQQLRDNLPKANLNEKQQIGLQYYEPLLERIPRNEITQYSKIIEKYAPHIQFEIVGSYRRGVATSGDIDIIITSSYPDDFTALIDLLVEKELIIEILARGQSKCLAISQLSASHIPRRIDFLFTSIKEYPFAILYFTGSKDFNTFFRSYANEQGYSLNEHTITSTITGKFVDYPFETERDIFDFIGLDYIEPIKREHFTVSISISDKTMPQQEQPISKTKTTIKTAKTAKTAKTTTKPTTPINFIYNEYKKNGISALANLDEDTLISLILKADDSYYNTTISEDILLTDTEYDIMRTYIEKTYPLNQYFMNTTSVGAPPSTTNKIKLPVYMGSMNKIKQNDTQSLMKWLNMFKGPYIISCKLDGVSGLYVLENDGTEKLFTRGDGNYGQDISHMIPYLNLPKLQENTRTIIRGEFIISKNIFKEKYAANYSNSRNLAAGIINRHKNINDNDDIEKYNNINFVTYEVIEPIMKPSDQLKYLSNNGFNITHFISSETINHDILAKILTTLRKNYCYEIDGLIITNDDIYQRKNGNPEHSFAFKMISSDQIANATVVDVIWAPSKDGYLKPRIQVQPITVGNVKITYLNGFNAAYVFNNKIGPNSVIQIIRSGDVIPHILDILTPANEPKMPSSETPYHWTKSGIDIILDNIEDNIGVKLKQITLFFRKIGVEELSEGNIHRIMNAGFDSVQKIIQMTINDFLSINGFQEKMAAKLYSGIKDKLSSVTIEQLMVASNIFPRGMSTNKIKLILDTYPDILTNITIDSIQHISKLKGMSLQSANAFIETVPVFLQFIDEIIVNDSIKTQLFAPKNNDTQTQTQTLYNYDKSHLLDNKSVVMTGFRDAELVHKIESVGGIVSSTMNKKISFVLCKNPDSVNNKLKEAHRLNIPIISKDDFMNTYFHSSSG